jgi:hypothetical protein
VAVPPLCTLRAGRSTLLTYIERVEDKTLKQLGNVSSGSEWRGIADQLTEEAGKALGNLRATTTAIDSVLEFLSNGDLKCAASVDLESPRDAFLVNSRAYFKTCQAAADKLSASHQATNAPKADEMGAARDVIDGFWSVLSDADDALTELWAVASALETFKRCHLHVLADAGFGKTHLTCHIALSRVKAGLPAILLLGEQFGKGNIIENRIREICDIPQNYSWTDFVAALESYAEAY